MKLWRENDDIRICKATQERNIHDVMSSFNQSTVQSVHNTETKILKEKKHNTNTNINSNSVLSSSINIPKTKQVSQDKKKGNN